MDLNPNLKLVLLITIQAIFAPKIQLKKKFKTFTKKSFQCQLKLQQGHYH